MNCEAVRRVLGAWLDRELGLDEAEKVGEHLERCPLCLAEKAQLERLQGSIKNVLEERASQVPFETIWHGVERRILERKPWPKQLRDWARSALWPRRLAWAIPAVVIVLLGVLSLERFFPNWRWGLNPSNQASVESIDGHGFNVALLREAKTKTTVIWLFENQEGEDETSVEPASGHPAI